MQIFNFLKGKKTYIVGLLMIVLGYLTDNNEMILSGLAFITLRAGVKDAK